MNLAENLRNAKRFRLTTVQGNRVWATENEIDFLTHLASNAKGKQTRRQLQERYRASMHLRDDWGWIDSNRVRKWLDLHLNGG